MENVFSNLDSISRQLMQLTQPKKPKMLVVDDEPDNLDLLYRTFRRDFEVLRADSGLNALSVLAQEGEVAVIISDQRMPEMKGTEFLSKTLPEFPDTVRIILTGFTDVEDLVEAINAGQVYKYITKPWDPNELKTVVQRATETYELLKQRTEELQRSDAQTQLLSTILQVAQESDTVDSILAPLAKAFGVSFGTDICILQLVEDHKLTAKSSSYTTSENIEYSLEEDELVQEAITTHQMQVWVNTPSTAGLNGGQKYLSAGIQSHLIIPILYRNQVLGILSLQWQKKNTPLSESELKLIHLSAQQVGLALSATLCQF
jgi:response regulator RpfG family c-di-GMP phosphodiesterase